MEENQCESSQNPYESSQVPAELPRESLEELRERLRHSGVKTKDFDSLAMWVKIPGALMVLIGLVWAIAAVISGHLWGVLLPFPGLVLFIVGYGLGKYKPWAWLAAVVVLIPAALLCMLAALALSVMAGGAGLFTFLIPLSFGYVCWVLISPTGRMRYRLMVDVTAREGEVKQRVRAHDRAVAAESLDQFLQTELDESVAHGLPNEPAPE